MALEHLVKAFVTDAHLWKVPMLTVDLTNEFVAGLKVYQNLFLLFRGVIIIIIIVFQFLLLFRRRRRHKCFFNRLLVFSRGCEVNLLTM